MKRSIFLVSFLFSLAVGVAAYTNSSFIETIGGKQSIGILFAVAAGLAIAILGRAASTIARVGARNFFLSFALMQILSLIALTFPVSKAVSAVAFVCYNCSIYVVAFAIDIFFEHVMPVGSRGKTRGTFLLLGNVAWLFAPLLGIYAKDHFGYTGIYATALALIIFTLCIVRFGFLKYKDPAYTPHRSRFSFIRVLRRPRLRTVIVANFILQFFYAWMVIYTPIYLHEYLHFSWNSIALIFTCMLTSFVILDYPLGRIADRLGSEKEMAAIGFLIMAASALGLGIIAAPSVLTAGILLFFSRVGAATVEAMTEIHFFKIAKDSDPGLLCAFRDLPPASYIVAPLLGTAIIFFLPFQSIFTILAVLLFFGFFAALGLEKNHRWGTRAHRE